MQATAHPEFVDKFPAEVAAVDANVVVDGRVVTGRGPAAAMEFALALVEQLYGKGKVDEIAKPMMVRYEPGYAFEELNPVQWRCSGTPRVLIPVANGSEEMEVLVTVDVLRRAKADVVVASAEEVVVVARHGTRIVADALLRDAAGQQFDLIVVPGGMPGVKTTLADKVELMALLKEHAAAGRAYGAIGAATAQVLEPHGLIRGSMKATTCASRADRPSECGSRVVVDGNLATSGSTGTAMEFALAVVEKLLGPEAAREVAEALLFV